jgi:hypothetical protein
MGDVSVIMAGITMKKPSIIQAVQVLRCHQYTKHTLCNSKENKNRSASFLSSCASVSTPMSKSPVTSFPVIPTESETPQGYAARFINFYLSRRSRLTLHDYIILWIFDLSLMYSYFLRFVSSIKSPACPTIILHSHTISNLTVSYSFLHLLMNRFAYLRYQPYELISE